MNVSIWFPYPTVQQGILYYIFGSCAISTDVDFTFRPVSVDKISDLVTPSVKLAGFVPNLEIIIVIVYMQ